MSPNELQARRGSRNELEDAVRRAGALLAGGRFKIRGTACTCPFCDDKNPSAGIYEKDGVWHFKCHGGCGFGGDVFDVLAKLEGKAVAELLRDESGRTASPKPLAPPVTIYPNIAALEAAFPSRQSTFTYTNPDTKLPELVVIRYVGREGKKCFVQCSPTAGGFWMKKPEGLVPLYNRSRVRAAETVVVVEGEKCVHALAEVGIVATTSPGGALKAELADWTPLNGKRAVYLWPDHDAPEGEFPKGKGDEHMRIVARIIEALPQPPRVNWIDPAQYDLPPKGDVVDYLARYQDRTAEERRTEIEAVLQDAEPIGASRELRDDIEAKISGQRRAIPFPWKWVSKASQALLPGTVTVVCGDPGACKSFFVLTCALHWHEVGVPIAIKELEDNRAYHLNRVLAIRDGNSKICDNEWVENNGEETRAAFRRHAEFIDKFGRVLFADKGEQESLDQLRDWVLDRAKAGCEIIIIDPITAAVATKDPWIQDLRWIMAVKSIAQQYGCRIILVTHPKKGKHGTGMDDLAGGAAYPRHAQTVLWLDKPTTTEAVLVSHPDAYAPTQVQCNRSIQIRKARNGHGGGMEVGFYFDGATFGFREFGFVQRS